MIYLPTLALSDVQRLYKELQELPQADDETAVDLSTIQPYTRQLIDHALLMHKDRLCRSLVACSLAQILRIFAPDAPYTQPELADLFAFLFKQLDYLWKLRPEQKQVDDVCYVVSFLEMPPAPGKLDLMSERNIMNYWNLWHRSRALFLWQTWTKPMPSSLSFYKTF